MLSIKHVKSVFRAIVEVPGLLITRNMVIMVKYIYFVIFHTYIYLPLAEVVEMFPLNDGDCKVYFRRKRKEDNHQGRANHSGQRVRSLCQRYTLCLWSLACQQFWYEIYLLGSSRFVFKTVKLNFRSVSYFRSTDWFQHHFPFMVKHQPENHPHLVILKLTVPIFNQIDKII